MADNKNNQNIFQGGQDWNKLTFDDATKTPAGEGIFHGGAGWVNPKPNAVDDTFKSYADENITKEQYLYNRKAYSTTDESFNIRTAWETPPSVSIENGVLKLSGTKSFLESDTAKQLRAIFNEMKGQTYNTEALNQQIEAWNASLAEMAKANLEAVDNMDTINRGITENGTNESRTPLTWEEFQRISQAAAVGRDSNAANSDKLIFVGYEWDDEGNKTPKYVKAKDFYDEFNSIKDEDKRSALSALYTQAGEGDAGAAAKLAYLTGGQNTPVNVTYDPTFRFKDTLGVFAANTLTGLADAADFVTMWTFFGLPRQAARVTRGLTSMANGGDFFSGYEEPDIIKQKIKEYRGVVDWQNQYFMELTPGSTELAAVSGSVYGGVLGLAYSLWAGGIASQAAAAAASGALTKAGDFLLNTGQGVARTFEINAITGKVQTVQFMQGERVVGRAGSLANGAASTLRATVVLPKGLFDAAPKLAESIAKVGGRLALESKIVAFSRASGGLKAGEREFLTLTTAKVGRGSRVGLGELGFSGQLIRPDKAIVYVGKELTTLRMQAAGLQMAARLAPLAGGSVLRNVDNYFALSEESRPANMSDYVLENTVRDIIAGAVVMGAGVAIHSAVSSAKAAKIKPTRVMDAAQALGGGTQGGFYSEDPIWVWNAAPPDYKLLKSGKTNIVNKDIVRTASSIATVNGEKLFFSDAGGIISSAIPGMMSGSAGAGTIIGNTIEQIHIEPSVGGVNLVTTSTDATTGKTFTKIKFFTDPNEAEKELETRTTPAVNPSTLMNSDLAATGNIVPFKIGGRSALKYLPNGVSRARIQPDITYLTPSEYAAEVTPIVEAMTPELRAAYEKAMVAEDIDSLSQQIYAKDAPAMDAPRLFVPRTEAEAIELAQSVARAQAVAAANPNSSPVMPIRTEPDDVEILKRRRMVTERTFVSTPENDYQQTEYNPITLHTNLASGEENTWSGDAPNGAMSYAIGEDTNYIFAEDIMTTKDLKNTYKAASKTKDYNDFLALAALNQIGVNGTGVLDIETIAPGDWDNIEEAVFRQRLYPRVPALRNSLKSYKEMLDNGVISADRIHEGIEFRKGFTQEPEALKFLDRYEKFLIKNTERAKKWLDKQVGNKPQSYVLEDAWQKLRATAESMYKDTLREGVRRDLATKGKKIVNPIAVPAQVDFEKGIAFFAPGEVSFANKVANGNDDDSEYLIHLPKGTKIVQYAYPSTGYGTKYEWVADLSSGYNDAGREILDPDEGSYGPKELFVNNPNGKKYTPKALEYDPSTYMIYDNDNRFSSGAYTQVGKDLLEPTGVVTGHKDGQYNMYEITKPSGVVNRVNSFLRKYGPMEDSIENRWEVLKNTQFHGGDLGSLGITKNPGFLSYNIKSLAHADMHSVDDGFVFTDGSPLSKEFAAAKHARKTPASQFANELEDVLRNNVVQYLKDNNLIKDGDYVLAYATGQSDDWVTELPDKVVEDTLSAVDALVEKYKGKLPSGYSGYLQQVIDYGTRGSHAVKNVPMLFTHRGLNDQGNFINRANADLPFAGAKPGDHITTNDFMFTTFNAMAPFYYSNQAPSSTAHQYVLTIGTPKDGEIYYYGDKDSDFNSRTHYNDGGAAVIPIGSGMTVVSRVELTPDITWLTLVRDGKDGTPYSGPIDKDVYTLQEQVTKKRKTVEVEQRTPRNIAVTEYGLPKKWFSNMDEALDYKNESAARSIYKIDESAEILDRPPVTMDNVYAPSVRGEAGLGGVLGEQDFSYTPNTADSVAKFDGLMAGMETLTDSPTDYAQGIVDIARTVQDVFTEISKAVDVDAIYEDYARQIAEGVEQPTVPDNIKETFKPLTDMLHKLGLYFDPSGKSLTKDFYLPTGAPSKKLASVEDAILHPERAVDADQPVDGSLDDILVDPMRIGSSGFWEKRSGELFLDEDGNFTMAKAGTLEENLTAYVVSALTRGQNRLLVAANNEVARSKYDRNRNQITSKQALAGLKDADRNRGRIRAAQLKNAKGYDQKLKEDKLNELADNYSDKKSIDAIEDAYNSTDFAKEIDYTRRTNEVGTKLGYRKTLTINPIKGSALRFGSNNGFRGIANDIRKASHITVTGTKWAKRYGEYVCVGFGMDESQSGEYEFTRIEPAVNLGDSANLMFASDRAAATLFKDISNNIEEWSQRGGWGLLNALQDFARQNFPLLSDPEYTAQRMFQTITRDYAAYNDVTAFNTAVMSDLSDWIKQNAARNINSAIEMADLTNLDDRTINAIDTIMTKAYVGTAVYNSKIVSALQRATYSATLAFNPSPAIGNLLSEPERIIDVFGYKVFAKALKKFLNKKEVARVKATLNDLPSRFADDREMVGLAEKAKTVFGRASEAVGNVSMGWLQKSEELKNVLFWFAAEENAKLMYPNDPSAQLQSTLRMFNDTAIAGGPGTTPGVANSNLGRMAFILKTFSLRNWDDFIEMTEQIGHSRSGSYKWDHTNRGSDTGGQGGYGSTAGKKKFNYKKAGQFIGGTLLRRYLLWLMVLGPLGRSIWDALGGDPTGLTENFSRGLYDDEGTDEYEGMTPLDNIINAIPTGFILGTLKDFYFAARRAGVDTGNFFGAIDIDKDPRLQKDLAQHLPLGTMTRRVGDMLELVDRGYSFNSFGNKTYAAPQNLADTIKGFMLGKNATSNAQAYNKYRYGSVNIWGDIFEGDWLDFAMSANPFAADMGMVKMDTTRTDYNGVFHGSYNDVPTMQAAVADLRERRSTIIREYNEDLEKYTGQFEGLNDSERKAKAAERREKKIDTFTNDVSRLVDAYTEAGNALSDKQINTLMYLFDFNEGDEDTYDSQLARERYVEAGLPDLNPVNQVPKQDKETGEIEEQNYFQRSLVYQNAVQGRYGIPREAAKAVDSALADFKDTYKEYKKRVSDLNDKAYSASKGSAERKRLQSEVEKVQEEYLNQLYAVLTPVVQQYGTEVLSSNDVIESLQPYMSSMVPYSSIKKYGLQFNNGNDIVWGQLSDWVKSRWGASAPTAGSDPEITNGIKEIKNLKDQGKISQAKSQARLLLDRVARGSLSARNNDVIELRSLLYE